MRQQDQAGGALARIRVIGVDSFDKTSVAKSFIHTEGVTFPVASDPEAGITSGLFYFDGDPYAVFVNGDGTIARIVRGRRADAVVLHRRRARPHSQRNVSAAATGAATAQTASTTQDSAGTAAPLPSVACSADESAAAGSSLAKLGQPAGQLGERDDHAAQQQEDEVEAVGRGQVHLGPQRAGHEEADAGEGGRAEQHGTDGAGHRRRAAATRVPAQGRARPGAGRRPAAARRRRS